MSKHPVVAIATRYTVSGELLLDEIELVRIREAAGLEPLDPRKRYWVQESVRGRELLGEVNDDDQIIVKAYVRGATAPDSQGRMRLGIEVEFATFDDEARFLDRYIRGGASLTPNFMKLTIEDGEGFDFRPPNENPFLTTGRYKRPPKP